MVPNAKPETLSYFTFSYIDFIEFQKAYNITMPSNSTLELLNGKVASDIVFKESELVSLASAFYDERLG